MSSSMIKMSKKTFEP